MAKVLQSKQGLPAQNFDFPILADSTSRPLCAASFAWTVCDASACVDIWVHHDGDSMQVLTL